MVGQCHRLEYVTVIGEECRMKKELGGYAGITTAEAREAVVAALEAEARIAARGPYRHEVPVSHRSGERIEPLISLQWFMRMDELAAPAIEAVQSGRVRIHPEGQRQVYLDWMEAIRRWCISRQLWWGHQLPVWYRGEETHVGETPPEGAGWERDPDVLDTWFSSALWPFATLGWPDETPELRAFYPTDVLSTARDILFLWVARMIVMGLEFPGDVPFEDVYVHSVIQAPDGRRMSKSLGTGIDPVDEIETHGADAVRFGLLAMSSTQDVRYSAEKIQQGEALANKLWNASRLVLLGVGGDARPEPRPRAAEDRWILGRLIEARTRSLERIDGFDFSRASLGLYDFVYGELCDWYLELVKPRLYDGEPEVAATLLYVLRETLGLAPRRAGGRGRARRGKARQRAVRGAGAGARGSGRAGQARAPARRAGSLVSEAKRSWSPARAEAYLRSLELFGMRFGLDRMQRLMTAMGAPQRRFASIHVVGTNGKSSTVRMAAAILERHGLRTGAYLSPHLAGFNERVRIGERDLDEDAFAAAVERAAHAAALVDRTLAEGDRVTQFEALTAAAYGELAARGVDVDVIEAGLGGRYDATNLLPSRAPVLTNVGLEHTRWLGPTIADSAEEKLAVVPDGGCLVAPKLHPDAEAVAQRVVAERSARLVRAPESTGEPLRALGAFQRSNFALARTAAEAFLGSLDERAVERAAAEVEVPGRLQAVGREPLVLYDGAHNPAGAEALAAALPEVVGSRPLVAVIGVLDDKDAAGMLRSLLPLCSGVVFTRSMNPRSLSPATLASLAAKLDGPPSETVGDPTTAVERARELAGRGGAVIA